MTVSKFKIFGSNGNNDNDNDSSNSTDVNADNQVSVSNF
jgi:hypothetical protein